MSKKIRVFIVITFAIGLASATAGAATIKGVISGSGGGAPVKINITKDKAICGKVDKFDESLVISKSGGLKNAVVEIVGAGKAKPGKGSISQDGCWFRPHVITLTAGSSLSVENKDPLTHNFHTFGFENDSVNFSQPSEMKVKVLEEGFEEPEVIKVQCDIHEWMNGWVVVTEGSAVAITGGDGSFTIENVKPGSYKIKIWHEKLGEIEKNLTVADGNNVFNLKMGK